GSRLEFTLGACKGPVRRRRVREREADSLLQANTAMDRSVLATRLHRRGFQAVEPLKCAGHASIFRVREREDEESEAYVSKVVCLSGLDAQGQAGAQQEVSLLKGLSAHPNLIAYKQSFLEDGGLLFIIMTLAEDGDLCRVVGEAQVTRRVLPEAAVLTWLRQTLLGLEHLHKQGVVHRDLKSSNIFLCEGRRRIRIGDFGISTVLQSTAFASSCVGTPAYMSPELMRNERYDFHVDMWALGCICFELCSLDLPFAAASLLQLAMQVMDAEPAWHKVEGRSEDLITVNRWLLQKDVTNRPTASRVLQEPLFSEGGRASIGPTEEEWLSLAAPDTDTSCDRRRAQTTVSTAALSGSDTFSSKGWPTMPDSTGEITAGLEAPAIASFDRLVQQAREARHEFSKDEFAEILTTHQQSLLEQLKAVRSGGLHGFGEDNSCTQSTHSYCGQETPVSRECHQQRSQVAETVM
ncbi:unnamed protein product, partial [Effrenium voratum]